MAITIGRWDLVTDALFFLFLQLGAINLLNFLLFPIYYHIRSIDHNIPTGRVFEMVNYWQILAGLPAPT